MVPPRLESKLIFPELGYSPVQFLCVIGSVVFTVDQADFFHCQNQKVNRSSIVFLLTPKYKQLEVEVQNNLQRF